MAEKQSNRLKAIEATPRVATVIPFHARPDVDAETIEALEQLLEQARAGQILGVAFVAMRKRREFVGDATGEAYRNPTFARGMLAALDDHLRDLTRGK